MNTLTGLGTRLEELVSSADSWDPAKVAILRQAHIIATGVDKAVQPVVQRFVNMLSDTEDEMLAYKCR